MLTIFRVTSVNPTHTTFHQIVDDVDQGETMLSNPEYQREVARRQAASSPERRFQEDRLLVQGADGTSISLGDNVPKKDPNA